MRARPRVRTMPGLDQSLVIHAAPALAQSIAPPAFVLPVALVTLVAVGFHVASVVRSVSMPASRKRIRTAAGFLMMVTVPVLAYAFGLADTADQRGFVLSWMTASGLLLAVLGLAGLDVVNNFRIVRAEKRELDTEGTLTRAMIATIAREQVPLRHGATLKGPAPAEDPPRAPPTGHSGPSA